MISDSTPAMCNHCEHGWGILSSGTLDNVSCPFCGSFDVTLHGTPQTQSGPAPDEIVSDTSVEDYMDELE